MTLKTLADLRDAYQETLPPGQRQADVRATLTQLGQAVAPEKTLQQIPLTLLQHPARQLSGYLQERIEQQTLKPGMVFYVHACLELLDEGIGTVQGATYVVTPTGIEMLAGGGDVALEIV